MGSLEPSWEHWLKKESPVLHQKTGIIRISRWLNYYQNTDENLIHVSPQDPFWRHPHGCLLHFPLSMSKFISPQCLCPPLSLGSLTDSHHPVAPARNLGGPLDLKTCSPPIALATPYPNCSSCCWRPLIFATRMTSRALLRPCKHLTLFIQNIFLTNC